jgi:hypothetical protein
MVPESSVNMAFIPEEGKWRFVPNLIGLNHEMEIKERTIQPRQYYTKDTTAITPE